MPNALFFAIFIAELRIFDGITLIPLSLTVFGGPIRPPIEDVVGDSIY